MAAWMRRSTALKVAGIVGLTLVACLALLLVTRNVRIRRYMARVTPTPSGGEAPQVVVVAGPDAVDDTWLNPDVPGDAWHEADLVHLQGPLTPDRVLLRFDLAELPQKATVVSATLSLRVELWGDVSHPGAAVAYRVLVPWEGGSATYDDPWSVPGLAAGEDYDPTPIDLSDVPDTGRLTLDVTEAVWAWRERGEPNHGLVVMMAKGSHNQAHYWVYLSEQPAAADRPLLKVYYEAGP